MCGVAAMCGAPAPPARCSLGGLRFLSAGVHGEACGGGGMSRRLRTHHNHALSWDAMCNPLGPLHFSLDASDRYVGFKWGHGFDAEDHSTTRRCRCFSSPAVPRSFPQGSCPPSSPPCSTPPRPERSIYFVSSTAMRMAWSHGKSSPLHSESSVRGEATSHPNIGGTNL